MAWGLAAVGLIIGGVVWLAIQRRRHPAEPQGVPVQAELLEPQASALARPVCALCHRPSPLGLWYRRASNQAIDAVIAIGSRAQVSFLFSLVLAYEVRWRKKRNLPMRYVTVVELDSPPDVCAACNEARMRRLDRGLLEGEALLLEAGERLARFHQDYNARVDHELQREAGSSLTVSTW